MQVMSVSKWISGCYADHTVENTFLAAQPMQLVFFFHEYGRRVGMVPKSSLKGGKNSLMVEKRTKTPNTTQTKQPKQNTTTQDPQAESPPSCSLSSVQGETCETSESVQKEA